jgi:hypothetical protein
LLVATALTQIYGYIVENGLEYSYVVTREAFICQRIKEDEPHSLDYHLAQRRNPTLRSGRERHYNLPNCRKLISTGLLHDGIRLYTSRLEMATASASNLTQVCD